MKINDLTGKRFGRLTVIERVQNNQSNKVMWRCLCDCGKETIAIGSRIYTGKTKSCGCLTTEKTVERSTKHGLRHTHLYQLRMGIIDRCNNPKNKSFEYYGGRGIKICPEWADKATGAQEFCSWATSHGFKKGLAIDRIDVNGDYSPDNCRFVTMKEQCQNRRPRRKRIINNV